MLYFLSIYQKKLVQSPALVIPPQHQKKKKKKYKDCEERIRRILDTFNLHYTFYGRVSHFLTMKLIETSPEEAVVKICYPLCLNSY